MTACAGNRSLNLVAELDKLGGYPMVLLGEYFLSLQVLQVGQVGVELGRQSGQGAAARGPRDDLKKEMSREHCCDDPVPDALGTGR
jgi:hypothetical protein